MEALIKQLIAIYLTKDGKVFVAQSYSIPTPDLKGDWTCPDFVALDFERCTVLVVEVTTNANVNNLIRLVRDREKQWFQPLRAKLDADEIATGWPVKFLGFVRKHNLDEAKGTFAEADDVTFEAIEDATFQWEYWSRREAGLPEYF